MLIASLAGKEKEQRPKQQSQQGGSSSSSMFSTVTLVPVVVFVMVAFGLGLSYAVDAIAPAVPALVALGAGDTLGGGGM